MDIVERVKKESTVNTMSVPNLDTSMQDYERFIFKLHSFSIQLPHTH